MSTRVRPLKPQIEESTQRGLPQVSYYPPLVVTLLASVFLLAVLAVLTFITGLAAITQVGRLGDNGSSGAGLTMFACGLVSLLCLVATVFFVWSVIKGVRDLLTPLHYTRGVVADKRVIGGRRAGTWLGVFPNYSGPDLAIASQAEAPRSPGSGARSGETPGQGSTASHKSSGYLSADRISAEAATETTTRRIFRVDAASHAVMEAGDEVLVAHSRFLEHIFYVARLNGGEWESYKNKALI